MVYRTTDEMDVELEELSRKTGQTPEQLLRTGIAMVKTHVAIEEKGNMVTETDQEGNVLARLTWKS